MSLKDLRRVCVAGADKQALALIIPELIQTHDIYGTDGLVLYIYTDLDFETLLDLEEEPDLYDESLTYHIYVQVIEYLEDYLQYIDVLIIWGMHIY